MKTPMQELIDYKNSLIKDKGDSLSAYQILNLVSNKAEELLEKEKEVMCEFAEDYVGSALIDYPKVENVFNQTFNTENE